MPAIKLYQHGFKAGCAPGKTMGKLSAKRDVVNGWSAAAARRNTDFLKSIALRGLDGFGVTFTLTLKRCPESSEEWHRMRRAVLERYRRLGFTRLHWVTEWQRRGVPHLHGMAYFPEALRPEADEIRRKLVIGWCMVAAAYSPAPHCQHTALVNNAVGWMQYLGKHAARGCYHYQRSKENIPAAWRKTGRVWGHLGDWPTEAPMAIELTMEGYHAFRRLVRSYRVSKARSDGHPRRIRAARRMLQDSDPARSRMRGVSDWCPMDLQLLMVMSLAAQGYSVEH